MSMPRSSDGPHIPDLQQAPATIMTFDGAEPLAVQRAIAAEVPVNIIYGGIPYAVMMATPSDLEDFALGFSLTEGVIERAADIRGMHVEEAEGGLMLAIDLAPDRLHAHLARKRALAGRTGCGVCGIDDLSALPQARRIEGNRPTIALAAIRIALGGLEGSQPLNRLTRGVHAAAWADSDGTIRCIREDVGRHNALDKLIGSLCRSKTNPCSGFGIITSRCSFEMVEKIAAFGGSALVAISAPTSLALERARRLDIALIGIARSDSVTIFHGLERIRRQGVPA